ncbi:hypothetical protein Ddye_027516 [Dipteronia dyeriana]|uniref:Senescence regulator n=1 Tax=Dipteronia dyeriana TaxID=168575 RepID=A0AAD9WQK3_9ROSI|nr:hypothetical protein Ddye_027516 [Dipteronia dyeriana]
MENGYGYGVWRSLRDGDFEEEDVWAVLKERKKGGDSNSSIFETKNSINKRSTSGIIIPRGSSSSSTREVKQQQQQQSAPVTIPDWSKICGKKTKVTFKHHDYEDDDDDDGGGGRDSDDDDDDEEDDEDEYKVPPHELIARRLARSQISTFSVFEGAGRTLKGRDLSKVRNAVLTRTGFLE